MQHIVLDVVLPKCYCLREWCEFTCTVSNGMFLFVVTFQPVSIGTLPLPMQELAIVEDLLFLMMVSF